jgi:hypothetical protein
MGKLDGKIALITGGNGGIALRRRSNLSTKARTFSSPGAVMPS